MDWQPIETLTRAVGTRWQMLIVTDGRRVVPVEDYGDGYWDLTRGSYDGDDELDFDPTHWMPLPEPPKVANEKEPLKEPSAR